MRTRIPPSEEVRQEVEIVLGGTGPPGPTGCLNESWFLSLEDAREKVEAWRKHYNEERPHGALDNLAPLEYASLVR